MEEKEQLDLLVKLGRTEEFQLWRDLVVKPSIEALEAELANPMELTEANLKAKVMHLNSLKYFFNGMFEQIEANLKLNK